VEPAERSRLNEQLARLADGDREAFHPVFLALLPVLRRFAARHAPPQEADDLAQEALVKVFAQASRFDPDRDALAWAVEIASWEIRTWRRRQQRRREDTLEAAPSPSLVAPAPSPEDLAVTAGRNEQLDRLLNELPPLDRETLEAYALDERPSGVPAPTFRKRVERGLRRVRRLLGIPEAGERR
jgi:RNA polymerase sigma-70 factor (ECF subfamily)